MQDTDDAPPEVPFLDLAWYYGAGVTALDPASNTGAQLERLQNRLGDGFRAGVLDYSPSDETLDIVSRLRPVERRLARMSEAGRVVLHAMFSGPYTCHLPPEMVWLEKTATTKLLPLGLLLLAARALGLGAATLARWAEAATPTDRTDAAAGVVRLRNEARRLRDEVLQEWRATGVAPGLTAPRPVVLPDTARARRAARTKQHSPDP